MPPCVFVSHASQDVQLAQRCASYLRAEDIEVRLDARELGPGSNFAAFMESALATSDYCFVLWSASARDSQFVTEEWQNAWSKGVAEKRAFLVIGRLEDIPVPVLLQNRVWVNLFPSIEPGLSRVVSEWLADRQAASVSGREVAKTVDIEDPAGVRVYITSDLYGFTHPARIDLRAGVLLDQTLQALGLVKELRDQGGRIGLQLEYSLQLNGHAGAEPKPRRSRRSGKLSASTGRQRANRRRDCSHRRGRAAHAIPVWRSAATSASPIPACRPRRGSAAAPAEP